MTVYAVGDIQGCYEPLRRLLDKVQFKPGRDQLWVAGDMVNRGPDSLATLRYLKSLGSNCTAVLGNHDLHLLAVAARVRRTKKKDTFGPLLSAPDSNSLIDWLRHRPLLHHDAERQVTMVHAGIPPIWTLKQACLYARKLEKALQGENHTEFLQFLFKSDTVSSMEEAYTRRAKLKLTAAYLTRMRFCDKHGRLDLDNKTASARKKFAPWYSFPDSPVYKERIIFGHWAALEGNSQRKKIHALDTGCVWGKCLTALNLDDYSTTSVDCCYRDV
ncbi:symmetrical bis(5'-nucleosyl)-tetraphosphatase [Endozoicomonas arenosclerae]|uniref:symmetrical bis(5'-nucleosyl)-tetraphosphatase n=1 Tax=Endozoicomonas arenosclerae TaxID=1633495 RepID=UPI000784D7EE|nr:symmetrical bis(5'-nucleosyl)-tetraphosphatase [Endozoicomonas arenosclerae]